MLSPVAGRTKGARELQSLSMKRDIFEFYNLMQPRLPNCSLADGCFLSFLATSLGTIKAL